MKIALRSVPPVFTCLVLVSKSFAGIAPGDVNVAPIGTATQSTTAFGGSAERGNDNNTSGVFGQASVTHTAAGDLAPTWEVDLGITVTMSGIVLWNRTDCCAHRLTNFRVEVLAADGAELFGEIFFPDGVTFPDTLASGFEILLPEGIAGQVVRITRLGPDSDGSLWLSLAEVQVFADPSTLPVLFTEQPAGGRAYVGACSFTFSTAVADPAGVTFQWQKDGVDIAGATESTLMLVDVEAADAGVYTVVATKGGVAQASEPAELVVPGRNLALGRTASQSSTGFGGDPGRANDGNIDGVYNGGSVSHTNDDTDAFWEVELFGASTIDRVVLWNRTDCCTARLSNLALRVLASNRSEVFSEELFTDGSAPETRAIELALPPGTVGRYVRVERLGVSADNNNFLSLAEVEVFGDGPLPLESPNLTQRCGVTTSQSSQLGSFHPGLAIDRNFGNFTHTLGTDDSATWEVDLGRTSDIGRIVLYNRTSCCGSRLRDITVEILDAAGAVQFASGLLNPENELGTFPDGPATLVVDVIDLAGGLVSGRVVRVRRTPDADLSGTAGQGNNDEANVLSLGEVEVFGAPTTAQRSGDGNQDGAVDTADVVFLVDLLFSGFNLLGVPSAELPCTTDAGNHAILDVGDNGAIDVPDIVGLASFLFGGGPPPPGGAACQLLDEALGCPVNAGCE